MNEHFTGDQKHLNHFLLSMEKKIINTCIQWVPPWMSTAHLTLLTILWGLLIILSGYLANTQSIHWLWGFSACIFMQYVTDMLDGEVGRRRNTGLIKWGFYMDHFLDYIFLCSIVIGYSFLLPQSYIFFALLCLAASGGFMVHFFLDFGITNDFKISFNRFGVSEARLMLIVLNVVLVFTGPDLLVAIFPFVTFAFLATLVFVVHTSQKLYGYMDMTLKREKESIIMEDVLKH